MHHPSPFRIEWAVIMLMRKGELIMQKLLIEGGHRLAGIVPINGAKNSVLPVLAATLLSDGESVIDNCPCLSDVDASVRILRHLGCDVTAEYPTVTVHPGGTCRTDIPDDLMREMRSSIIFLGALIARYGEAHLSYPGGCELGPRPIDLHLAALRRMGVHITESHGKIDCRTGGELHGADISLSIPSVGATENILLAAVTAKGKTTLRNAAREPEIQDLCHFLTACGAVITGIGEGVLEIEGISRLHGCRHRIIPDRIEAATYMAAVAAAGGALTLKNVFLPHVAAIVDVLKETGCLIRETPHGLSVTAPARLRPMKLVRTMPYPGFPTDAAAPFLAAACLAKGTGVFIETIFDNRYGYVGELLRFGAHIKVEGRMAVVEGVSALSGAAVKCTDLRGGAALVVAALAAEGETEITALHHIQRGYADLPQTLENVGAVIEVL